MSTNFHACVYLTLQISEWPSKENPYLNKFNVWLTIMLAFRMWSEVIPKEFEEDNSSPVTEVDIIIGFGKGTSAKPCIRFMI